MVQKYDLFKFCVRLLMTYTFEVHPSHYSLLVRNIMTYNFFSDLSLLIGNDLLQKSDY